MTATSTRPRTDRLTLAGLGIVAIAAAGTSFDALDGLAGIAGWARDVRPALPIIVDVLAAVSTRAWLSGVTSADAKRFAKRAALASITVSMIGNTLFHLIVSGWLHPSVALVIGVAMVPPLGLAAAAHLVAVLRPAEPVAEPVSAVHVLADTAPASLVTAEPVMVADAETDITADSRPDTMRTPKRTDTAAKVARIAAKHPDMKPADIATKVGVTDRTVRRHLAALTAA